MVAMEKGWSPILQSKRVGSKGRMPMTSALGEPNEQPNVFMIYPFGGLETADQEPRELQS